MATKLEMSKPLRIIGIQLFDDTLEVVRKVLKPGWYPFIKCSNNPGISENVMPIVDSNGCPQDYFRIEEQNLPRISLCAIAGKNGTGKSTLIDILYRILNNFAEATFLKTGLDETNEVLHAFGVHARLYFELDGVMKYIETGELGTTYYEIVNGNPQNINLNNINESQRDAILNGFFYTICVNYSLYAFNPNDSFSPFSKESKEVTDNKWIDRLFHKNDGYYIPLVLTPFREDGEIEVNNENFLAEQRLTTLSLLFHSQKKEFVEDFIPNRLLYRFDFNYRDRKTLRLDENPIHPELKECQLFLIARLQDLWEKIIADKYNIQLDPVEHKKQEIALFYLAYKTLKICRTYPLYRKLSDIDSLFELKEIVYTIDEKGNKKEKQDKGGNTLYSVSTKNAILWFESKRSSFINAILQILEIPDNHITIKIHQCIAYLKDKEKFKEDDSVLDVDKDLIKGARYETYDSMMMQLPPAFFITELRLKNKRDKSEEPEEITFNSMSSGERQLLFSLSYVFYHIKNIASIKEGGKRVVGYHHINLIFDEAELYYHPEYQRQFVYRLLECLSMCHINKTNIRSIHIMIITHSPFILSDIPETNILFLKKEDDEEIDIPQKTLGANIYDLLKGGFFLDYAMGDFVQKKLQDILEVNQIENKDEQRAKYIAKREEFWFTVNHIGEEYLHESFSSILEQLDRKHSIDYEERIQEQIAYHEKEMQRLANKLNKR